MKVRDMLYMLLGFSTVANKVEIKVDPKLLRPSDVTLQIPDSSKFEKLIGWKPEIKFEKTLQDTLDYWRDYFKGER